MRIVALVPVLPLFAAVAGCGQDQNENVMAPRANALTEAQVERALGPEVPTAPAEGVNGAASESTEQAGAAMTNSSEEEQP